MKHIIANFKSNKTRSEMQRWVDVFRTKLIKHSAPLSPHVILCPPFVHLDLFTDLSQRENISLGVQDISPFPAGAYTGAVTTQNLVGNSIRYAIVGHSERRKYFHENTQEIANKVKESSASAIIPILCVTKDEVIPQSSSLEAEDRSTVMVAYEPLEHIGTGTSDTLENILETRQLVLQSFGHVPYIYGGSVNEQTPISILRSDDIDGFLVGTACLDPERFWTLLLHY